MPYFGIFGLEFYKNIVMFEISTLKFFISESLTHTVNFGIGSAFSEGPGQIKKRTACIINPYSNRK